MFLDLILFLSGNSITSTTPGSVTLFDPMLDGRKEIAKYNKFMDEIYTRMNAAIKAKNLDPMDLKLLPNSDKVPRSQSQPTVYDVRKVSTTYSQTRFSKPKFALKCCYFQEKPVKIS